MLMDESSKITIVFQIKEFIGEIEIYYSEEMPSINTYVNYNLHEIENCDDIESLI